MSEQAKTAVGGGFLWESCGTREIMTPEKFSEEQVEIAKAGQAFSEKEILPRLKEIESKKAGLIPSLLKQAGELGLLMVDVPESYGGLGLGKTTSMLLAEQFSRVGSFSVSLGAHTGIGTLPIVYFGTDAQKKAYLPDLGTGKRLAAYALTEPSAGSDALAAKCKAVLSPDKKHYILNGTKQFITNAAFADVFIVFAKIDSEKFTGFIVDRTTPGFTVGPEEHKMGIRGSSTCSLIFEDAPVSVDNVLGEVGRGHKIAFNTLNVGRIKLGVGTAGTSKYALEVSAKYANERKQFGRSIGTFGLVGEKLADMAIRIFVAETMGYRTTGLVDDALLLASSDQEKVAAIEEFTVEASIIKIFGSEAFDFCADEAVQIHGGYGFVEEYHPERLLRDSRINRIFEGTNEINRLIVPGTIMKRAVKGQNPLLSHAQEISARLAKGDVPQVGDGELGTEMQVTELSKWITTYVLSIVAQKFNVKVAEQQEVLGGIADMITRCYALDSVVTRVQQILAGSDESKKTLARHIVTAFAPKTYGAVVHSGRHILMEVCDDKDLDEHLNTFGKLLIDWRTKVIAAKRDLASAVLEAEGYPL